MNRYVIINIQKTRLDVRILVYYTRRGHFSGLVLLCSSVVWRCSYSQLRSLCLWPSLSAICQNMWITVLGTWPQKCLHGNSSAYWILTDCKYSQLVLTWEPLSTTSFNYPFITIANYQDEIGVIDITNVLIPHEPAWPKICRKYDARDFQCWFLTSHS